jgi:hypothetical protein
MFFICRIVGGLRRGRYGRPPFIKLVFNDNRTRTSGDREND